MASRREPGGAQASPWNGSAWPAAALFVLAWVLVIVAFAAQLRYTNLVSWEDAFARSAVDRGPWAIISPAIGLLAWFIHHRRIALARALLLHAVGMLACLLLTEAMFQSLFMPWFFPLRQQPPVPAWRPAEMLRDRDANGAPPQPGFIPERPPGKPPDVGHGADPRVEAPWRRPPPKDGPRPWPPGGPPADRPAPGFADKAGIDMPSATPAWLAFITISLRKSYNGAPIYLFIAALAHALLFWRNLREREARVSDLEERLTVARADMLRLQLEPHFLFNTLNAIGTLVYRDAALADDLIARLSTLLRRLLDLRDEHTIALERELETVRAYVGIEQARFGERLRFEEDIAAEARQFPIPVLLLQPLAENAVRHGIEPLGRPGTLRIAAAMRGGMLDILVEDDGVGLSGSAGSGERAGFGLGLASARVRLEALYGSEAHIVHQPRLGGGTRIEIRLPKKLAIRKPDTP
jgi:two-component sensor histidine kinase